MSESKAIPDVSKAHDGHHKDVQVKDNNEKEAIPSSRVKHNMNTIAQNALQLSWTFGYEKNMINGVHNLSSTTRRAIFYTAAHTGVIYEYARRQQRLLQAHCHPISCCVVSEDKRWIVTADRGHESMLVIWDAQSGNPIRTIFQPHVNGVEAIDISPDALFLVTLSAVNRSEDSMDNIGAEKKDNTSDGTAQKKPFDQELAVWELTASVHDSKPLYLSLIATRDIQHAVRFNSYDIRELVTNGRERVIFWSWATRTLLFYSPSLIQKEFHQVIGTFTQSLFIPNSAQALTGTHDGDLILWDIIQNETSSETPFPERKAVKIVRLAGGNELQRKVHLTVIKDIDGFLVLGTSDGAVRFYDFEFRLVAWFEDLNAGPITSVSFASPKDPKDGIYPGYSDDSFYVPDFIVSTASAIVLEMRSKTFFEREPSRRRGNLLLQGINDAIHGLAVDPDASQFAICSHSGLLQLWDLSTKRLIQTRHFSASKLRSHALAFIINGQNLIVGFLNGIINILSVPELNDLVSLRLGKAQITDIVVSPDSSYFAALDAKFTIGIWSTKQLSTVSEDTNEWIDLGRCRAHSKPITGLVFSRNGNGQVMLVTVSEDRTLVEYCLESSSLSTGIALKQPPRLIEQSAVPTACCWHPELANGHQEVLIVTNDEYKLKQWNVGTQTYQKTTLGPTYGGPINKLMPLPLRNEPEHAAEASCARYCVYSTHEKVVGLLKLPLDGNPQKSMGLVAYPGSISHVDVTFDGRHVLVAGSNDFVVNLWAIHTQELDLLEAQGIEQEKESLVDDDAMALLPFLTLLEGGREGSLYNEIVNYFYLAQLRVQGEDGPAARGQIPLDEIPNLMRAVGFYPTDQEIQHMISEVRYTARFSETSCTVESIGLHDFIKLYLNYRPVFGIGKAEIEHVFQVLAKSLGEEKEEPATLRWDQLEPRLLQVGEAMSEEEVRNCLGALLGIKKDIEKKVIFNTPYTALSFAEKVLGFDDYENTKGEAKIETSLVGSDPGV